jgi:hypothetical protein
MKNIKICCLFITCFLLFYSFLAAHPQVGLRIVFIEPDSSRQDSINQYFHIVKDTARINLYHQWLNNPAAQMALDLYQRAWNIVNPMTNANPQTPVYYIALIKGGNYGDVGFQLVSSSVVEDHSTTPFIKLDPSDWVFNTTFLHETGHVILALLNGGRKIPVKEMASISHTTAALTDRKTAFDEGFAEHLETLAAHILNDPLIETRYLHRQFRFGVPDNQGEYNRPVGDLLTFSQTRTRYYDVRENNFAFAPTYNGADYLRVQMEKSRDFAVLRNANQLLQSEGFYATFFFSVIVRGNSTPTQELVHERQQRVLESLREMFVTNHIDPDTPFLVHFVETYMHRYPSEAKEIADVFLDLSHGVFVDRNAAKIWKDHYLGALKLDMAERDNETLWKARESWEANVVKNPKILYTFLGPQIRCEIPGQTVLIVAFEEPSPLAFDINTVGEGIIRMIPGITDTQIWNWISARAEKAFSSIDDFKKRSGVTDKVLSAMKF